MSTGAEYYLLVPSLMYMGLFLQYKQLAAPNWQQHKRNGKSNWKFSMFYMYSTAVSQQKTCMIIWLDVYSQV